MMSAARQARLEAGARYERTLEAVGCTPWFGIALAKEHTPNMYSPFLMAFRLLGGR